MGNVTKYMLDYDGLKVITDNIAKRCVSKTGFDAKINNTIHRVMRSFNTEFIQYATSFEDLPQIGTSGILYMVMKRPGDYIVYSFEDNKYVQVGASTFKRDFDPDVALDITSTNMVTNAAITSELNKKYTKTGMVSTPVDNSNELVESSGVKSALDLKANTADFSLMDKYDLRKIFYTEYANGAYLRVYLRFYNKDLSPNVDLSSDYKICLNSLSLGNLTFNGLNYINGNVDAVITNLVSTIGTIWHGTDGKSYHATIRIGYAVTVSSNYNNSIVYLFNTGNRLRFSDLTNGNMWMEITFTDKIPVELLMNSQLSIRELTSNNYYDYAFYGYRINNVAVWDSIYATTEVSADMIKWNIWVDDQQQYNVEVDDTTGACTFNIPVFR